VALKKDTVGTSGAHAFEPQLIALLDLTFSGGVRSLEAAGFKLGDDQRGRAAHGWSLQLGDDRPLRPGQR
jgi:hypothetical protein